MEHRGSNNGCPSNGAGNMFNTVTGSTSANIGRTGYLAQPGSMASLLQRTQEVNLLSSRHAPTTFTELLHEQHFSFLNGGRLVVDLRIEAGPALTEEVVTSVDSGSNPNTTSNVNNMSGPSAGNNSRPATGTGPVGNNSSDGLRCICGRKRKTPDSEGTSTNRNSNENATQEECNCEVPVLVQENSSGSMNSQTASSSNAHASRANSGDVVQMTGAASIQGNPNAATRGENNNRSGRSRRRGIPQRSIISATDNSSSEIPRYEPPSIAVRQGPVTINIEDQGRFSIQEFVARRSSQLRARNSASEGAQYSFSSMVSMLQSDTNPQGAGPSTRNVTDQNRPSSTPTGQYLQPTGVSIRNVNQVNGGSGTRMQLRSGVNGRDPRQNGEQNIDQLPIVRALPVLVDSANPQSFGPTFTSFTDPTRLQRATVRRVIDLLQGRPINIQGNQVLNNAEYNNELDRMRLDIDRMTYEDLLALGERIGAVHTGLTEEAILKNLKCHKHRVTKITTPEEPEKCCICLDEFETRQELGKLDCGHNFHSDCIKQWLMQKNFCPICKKTALPN